MKKFLALVAVVVAVVLGLLATDFYTPYRNYSGSVTVEIPPGTSALDVATMLTERGVLKYRAPFLLRYLVGRNHRSLKAGEYEFDRPLRPLDIYWRLV
ncbi:MAG TPA: aminodeoxychorismate lyase, partial [Terriglobia bacterium]|nr:aminodeoxychorismate lyase [Terriglobia bacterium]